MSISTSVNFDGDLSAARIIKRRALILNCLQGENGGTVRQLINDQRYKRSLPHRRITAVLYIPTSTYLVLKY